MAVAAFHCTSDNACDGSEPILAPLPFLHPRLLLHLAASGDYVLRNIAVAAARGDDSVAVVAAVVVVAVVWDELLLHHLADSSVASSTAVAAVHHTQTNGRPIVPCDDAADGAGMASSSAVDHTPKNSRKSTT